MNRQGKDCFYWVVKFNYLHERKDYYKALFYSFLRDNCKRYLKKLKRKLYSEGTIF